MRELLRFSVIPHFQTDCLKLRLPCLVYVVGLGIFCFCLSLSDLLYTGSPTQVGELCTWAILEISGIKKDLYITIVARLLLFSLFCWFSVVVQSSGFWQTFCIAFYLQSHTHQHRLSHINQHHHHPHIYLALCETGGHSRVAGKPRNCCYFVFTARIAWGLLQICELTLPRWLSV